MKNVLPNDPSDPVIDFNDVKEIKDVKEYLLNISFLISKLKVVHQDPNSEIFMEEMIIPIID